MDKLSYALGLGIGRQLAQMGANGKLKKLNVKLSEFTPEGWMKTNKKSPALMVSELNALLNEM